MITFQKVGLKVSEAAMMYALLATSLPGLLNPLLYGLVLDSYRDGYKKIIFKIFFCCKPKDVHTQELRGRHNKICERKTFLYGAVAKPSANRLVGTGFVSRYRLQPECVFKGPMGMGMATTLSSFSHVTTIKTKFSLASRQRAQIAEVRVQHA